MENPLVGPFERLGGRPATATDRRLLLVLFFMLRFIALSVPFYLLLDTGVGLLPLQRVVASNTAFAARIIGGEATLVQGCTDFCMAGGNITMCGPCTAGILLHVPAEPLVTYIEIVEACTGWRSIMAFTALVFALPGTSLHRRLLGIAIGYPVIYLVNIVRLSSLAWIVHRWGTEWFDLWHTFLWREGLVLVLFLMWVTWVEQVAWAGPGPQVSTGNV